MNDKKRNADIVLSIEGLKYYYPEGENAVLDGINMKLYEGECAIIIGRTGSGKSTLLKCIAGLIPRFYGGKFAGKICLKNSKNDTKNVKVKPCVKPSLLFQDPENQIVMNKVAKEISYPLEENGLGGFAGFGNFGGLGNVDIEKKVSVSARLLGIEHLLNRETLTLSSGEKQKVALASILCTGSRLLLMDEPTSMLDPESELDFLQKLSQLKDKGYTIFVSTHDPKPYENFADRYFLIENGKLYERNKDEVMLSVGLKYRIKDRISEVRKDANKNENKNRTEKGKKRCLVELKSVYFSYGKEGKDVLKGVNFRLYEGEIVSILGKNGAGKSTLLKHFLGLERPKKGKVVVDGKDTSGETVARLSRIVGYLSQNPSDYLFADTVEEEIEFSLRCRNISKEEWSKRKKEIADVFSLSRLMNRYPRDLSAGERERVALSVLFVCEPEVLVLDEPTRGLDFESKEDLIKILIEQKERGKGIVFATHDIEFAYLVSDKIFMLEDGKVEEVEEREWERKCKMG